ncbi:exonuclease SbcCD subunit D [Candidatus Babeliales bacterium]|nr:exonuclease SbcCD subunit D [Candidatus Babeliales bacterium]
MITLYHTADVHFGVENYGKIDAKTGIHTRLLDFKNALEECVNKAVEENIDLFLLCGDAYKTAYPTPTQQKLLCSLLLKLHTAKIPVAIIIGNHDHPLSFGKANALDIFDYLPLDNFYVFSKPESVTIKTKNGPVQVVGIPWPTRNTLVANSEHRFKNNAEIATCLSEKVGQIINSLAEQLDPTVPAILAGHLTVSSGIFSGSEKCAIFGTDPIFLPSQLAIPPFDYVALGHLHRHQNLNPKGFPPVVYSGSIERVDFGERKEDKGFCRVTIDKQTANQSSCNVDFIKVTTRPMIQVEVKLEAQGNQTEQILEQLNKKDLTDAIVKIVYHVPEESNDNVDVLALQRACSKAMYLVGIFPKHKIAAREHRAQLKVDMDLQTMLRSYFDEKKEMADKKELLIKKALELNETMQTPAAQE